MIPPDVWRRLRPVAGLAVEAGLGLYAVGGCVRDWLGGRCTKDIDLCVEGPVGGLAAEAALLWAGRLESFERFGTVRVRLGDSLRVDFAGARAESYDRPAALPRVRPAGIRVDLGRRDFTVNAMALKLGPDGAIGLLDPFGGEKDLRERVLRVLHEKSFSDDPTRLFRAARYAARLSLRPDGRTLALVEEASAGRFAGLLSRERIRQELLRTLEEADPGPAFALLRAWGLSSELHPAFVWPSEAGRFAEPLVRLGLCALKMGEAGSDFIFSLRLARGEARPLLAAVRESRSELSPAKPLPELALRVLRAGLPQAPPAAFDPILIGGEDLKRQGLKPGPDFSRILDAAARAQKKGEFADRGAALDWLRREAGGRM